MLYDIILFCMNLMLIIDFFVYLCVCYIKFYYSFFSNYYISVGVLLVNIDL